MTAKSLKWFRIELKLFICKRRNCVEFVQVALLIIALDDLLV